ncbi:MAG: hypothetical protein K0S71_187 [Clostridia bacterium]|jgi:hypothetical protein|nr:hypothetical protein [Clostridia bacterium]
MSDKNVELMKKLIEAKKNKAGSQSSTGKAEKIIGSSQKAFKSLKKGGSLDK